MNRPNYLWIFVFIAAVSIPSLSDANNVEGAWSHVLDWPLIAIHAALTPDGKVLTYGTNQDGTQSGQFIYDVWDPALGTGTSSHATLANTTGTDLFCSAQIMLPGSQHMLLTGGDIRGRNIPGPDGVQINNGIDDANIFNAADNSISTIDRMFFERWYPTVTTLPNGEILVQAGIDSVFNASIMPEIYNPQTGWRMLPGATSVASYAVNSRWWYPRSWVTPTGKVFGLTGGEMYELDPRGEGSIRSLGTHDGPNNYITSTAVMFRPGRILQIGGGTDNCCNVNVDATNQVSEININGTAPIITARTPMQFARNWPDSTVLPDGKVLVSGGSSAANALTDVALTAELYDPESDTWTNAGTAAEDRLYHSTALLLPDATVLITGGGAPEPLNPYNQANAVNVNAEIYYPPYLFDEQQQRRTLKPITSAPNSIDWNQSFSVNISGAGQTQKVVLIKTGSLTHSFDFEQRYLELDFSILNNQLEVNAPDNGNLAPPGYYMLFVIDQQGVPSEGTIISVGDNGPSYSQQAADWEAEIPNYFVRITNRQTGQQLHNSAQLEQLETGSIPEAWWSAQWIFEPVGVEDWNRIRNRWTNEYIHVEEDTGVTQVGAVPAGYWSSHWRVGTIDGHIQFENRYRPTATVNVSGANGQAQFSNDPTTTSHWVLEPTGFVSFTSRYNGQMLNSTAESNIVLLGGNLGDASQWQLVATGENDWVQIINKASAKYMHISNPTGAIQADENISASNQASHWRIVNRENYIYLINRSNPSKMINNENQQGYAEQGSVLWNYWSGHWFLGTP